MLRLKRLYCQTGPQGRMYGLKNLVRIVGVAAGLVIGTACLSLLLAAISFSGQVRSSAHPPTARTEIIVVFSGDPARFSAALGLLKNGSGRRILVVGQDNGAEIEAARAADPALIECCVDHDSRSQNTAQDAHNARNWILKNRFKSAILVTSTYHMPRAKLEFQRASPQTYLQSFGITSESVNVRRFWDEPRVARPFLLEFLKYAPRFVLGELEPTDSLLIRNIYHFLSKLNSRVLVTYLMFTLTLATLAVALLIWKVQHFGGSAGRRGRGRN